MSPLSQAIIGLPWNWRALGWPRPERVLVTCHRGPDGDSVGSMIALTSLLRSQGKSALLYNPDQIPRRLRWLPLARSVVRKLPKDASFDVTVAVDCAEARLLGHNFPGPEITGTLIVLDHHASGDVYGDIYVCDTSASSVGVLVARIADLLEWPLTKDAALAIYLSMASDTGTFRYANTNAEALHLAARLLDSYKVDRGGSANACMSALRSSATGCWG